MEEEIIVILGPTASGKTRLAVQLAAEIGGEIISADSRQVYKGMNVGTGKDLAEYIVAERQISYHLIDILEAGQKYNLSRFQEDFRIAASTISAKGNKTIVCGGTGLYIQSIIQGFGNTIIPENPDFRERLQQMSDADIRSLFNSDQELPSTRKRCIRALEIEEFKRKNPEFALPKREMYQFRVFGLNPPVECRRERISDRLKHRIRHEGMIQEVEELIASGLSYEMLEYYGLEYKYVAAFLEGFMRYDDMLTRLETEIHRYAKRQMTFFRSMEKKGIYIDWLDNSLSLEQKVEYIKKGAI